MSKTLREKIFEDTGIGCSNHNCIAKEKVKWAMGTNSICRCMFNLDFSKSRKLEINLRKLFAEEKNDEQ